MPKILNFQKQSQPFEIKNKTATKAEIIIYGSIGAGWFEDSISAKQFSDELKKLDATVNEITVRLNSPGGDVFEGWAIYNRLKQHKAKKIVYVDGMAASIASIIMLAGDEIIMGEGAQVMIHSAWTFAYGNSRDLESVIARLEDIDEQLITAYVKKTKKSRAEIREMVHAETWFDADQAIDAGLVDKKAEDTIPIAASLLDRATWIAKKPTTIVTQDKTVKSEIDKLQNKIEDFLARK